MNNNNNKKTEIKWSILGMEHFVEIVINQESLSLNSSIFNSRMGSVKKSLSTLRTL